MSAIIVCDVCGKQEPGACYPNGSGWHKPRAWFERTDADSGRTFTACSRECIDRGVEKKAPGFDHGIVLPI